MTWVTSDTTFRGFLCLSHFPFIFSCTSSNHCLCSSNRSLLHSISPKLDCCITLNGAVILKGPSDTDMMVSFMTNTCLFILYGLHGLSEYKGEEHSEELETEYGVWSNITFDNYEEAREGGNRLVHSARPQLRAETLGATGIGYRQLEFSPNENSRFLTDSTPVSWTQAFARIRWLGCGRFIGGKRRRSHRYGRRWRQFGGAWRWGWPGLFRGDKAGATRASPFLIQDTKG